MNKKVEDITKTKKVNKSIKKSLNSSSLTNMLDKVDLDNSINDRIE